MEMIMIDERRYSMMTDVHKECQKLSWRKLEEPCLFLPEENTFSIAYGACCGCYRKNIKRSDQANRITEFACQWPIQTNPQKACRSF